MILRQGDTAALYGAFYVGGERVKDFSPYKIECRLKTIEGRETHNLDSRIKIATDGSICVILEGSETRDMSGRILFSFRLLRDGNIVSVITKDFDVI